MKKQVIAVDCDDVLAEHVGDLVAWTNDNFGTSLRVSDYSDHWQEFWGVDKDEVEKRSKDYHDSGRHLHLQTKPGALDTILYLKRYFDLVVVTARRNEIIDVTREWLNREYPDIFSDVLFVPIWEEGNTITKADICLGIGADYLIDDLLRHCEIAAKCGIKSVLYGNYNWNKTDELPENVTRCSDWNEVREYFDNVRQSA